jgi:DNA-binding NtrC family response regulator
MKTILIAAKDNEVCATIRHCFKDVDRTYCVSTKKSALEHLKKDACEYLFIDIGFIEPVSKDDTYKSMLQPFWRISPDTEIIVMAPDDSIRGAVGAVKAGASNYLTYPINPTEVKYLLENIRKEIRFFAELKYLRDRFWNRDSLPFLQTKSTVMREVLDKVRAVAQTDTTVLLTGETGTGKGILANLIHRHSRRNEKQFIPVHCGAIPDTLLESELFGHEKGAFTGAIHKKLGKFEIAHSGTIFLDEIGTVSASMQVKLLQVLQEKFIHRLGGETAIQVDVRFIVATNSNLKQMCEDGLFRQDLFYRLNVFPIELTPLRERKEDIPFLVDIFLKRLNKCSLKAIIDIDPEVMKVLQAYQWPGNIRELENLIERAFVLEKSSILTPNSFPKELFEKNTITPSQTVDITLPLRENRQRVVEKTEMQYIIEILTNNQGKINRSAEQAGISVRQLHKLMTKYGIQKKLYRKNDSPG